MNDFSCFFLFTSLSFTNVHFIDRCAHLKAIYITSPFGNNPFIPEPILPSRPVKRFGSVWWSINMVDHDIMFTQTRLFALLVIVFGQTSMPTVVVVAMKQLNRI